MISTAWNATNGTRPTYAIYAMKPFVPTTKKTTLYHVIHVIVVQSVPVAFRQMARAIAMRDQWTPAGEVAVPIFSVASRALTSSARHAKKLPAAKLVRGFCVQDVYLDIIATRAERLITNIVPTLLFVTSVIKSSARTAQKHSIVTGVTRGTAQIVKFPWNVGSAT